MSQAREITIDQPRDIAPATTHVLTPLEMLSSAIERGADPALLEKLMALSERWEANQARKAFDTAMADAKANMGTVHKTTKGNYGMYADFASVARLVDPVLSEHGLSYRFKVNQNERGMQVTCVVRHRDGHSEETTLFSPVDTSGSKNAVQQIGSTQTYLQRYTLMAALGLAASKDDDGHSAGRKSDSGDFFDADALAEEGLTIAIAEGVTALGIWWTKTLTEKERKAIGPTKLAKLKEIAMQPQKPATDTADFPGDK